MLCMSLSCFFLRGKIECQSMRAQRMISICMLCCCGAYMYMSCTSRKIHVTLIRASPVCVIVGCLHVD